MSNNIDHLDTLCDLDEDAQEEYLATQLRYHPIEDDYPVSDEDLAMLDKPRSA